MSTRPRIAVVGGGITGLAAAYRLHNTTSCDLHLYEASSRLGGVLQTTEKDGFLLEGGPDCFISEKPRGIGLCKELGLESELIGTRTENRRSFIVHRGELHPVPEGFYLLGPSKLRPFLESPLLSWKGKLRAMAEPLIPKHQGEPDESLASFVRRRFGQEMLEAFAQPLLSGIYAADPETLSLRATFPRFIEMEEKYGSVLLGLKKRAIGVQAASGARYSLFVSLRRGMETLVRALEQKLPAEGLHPSTAVKEIVRTSHGQWQLVLASGDTVLFDALCLALPAHASAALLRPVHRRISSLLESVTYTESATLNMAFPESAAANLPKGFGYVCPQREKRPAMACTFTHQKFEGRAPTGTVLLRAFIGGAIQKDLLEMPDADLIHRVTEDVRSLLGLTAAPHWAVLQRWPRAMAQYTVGHVQRMLTLDESLEELPGLRLAGNWKNGVGIPDCIESGEWAADQLVASLDRLKNPALR